MEQEQLTRLIRKFADNTATAEEIQELQDWYRSVYAVENVEWPSAAASEKEELRQRMLHRLEQAIKEPSSGETGVRIVLPRLSAWTKVAACLLLAVAVWLTVRYVRREEPVYITIQNPSGRVQSITLPDSSHVWLNAKSSLRYASAFSGQRELFLEGEGYFDVTEDKEHPFTVHAGSLTTTVLGTAFDIKSFPEERANTITVVRGKVQVDHQGQAVDVLSAARQLQWDDSRQSGKTRTVDTNQVSGWQRGKFQFQGQTMEEIAGTLGRWYNMKFIFNDPAVRSCRLYVQFESSQPLSEILTSLGLVIDLQYVINPQNNVVTLSGKGNTQ